MYRRNASELGTADERLHGEGSGDGAVDDLEALADFSVHRSVESVCLCPADRTDTSLLTLPLCPRGGAASKTHKTRHRQHDVIQLRGAVDVLPPTAQIEYCTTFYIYWTATNIIFREKNIIYVYFQIMDYYYTTTRKRVWCIHMS